jgi:Family of unknown function (DUF6516)
MSATLLFHNKDIGDDGTITELVAWELDEPGLGSTHKYKYRFYYGLPNGEWVRYDNERGKGDHKHINGVETFYKFVSLEKLLDDFDYDIENWGEL